MRVTATAALAVLTALTGCGGDPRREVAERYVEAVETRDWAAACGLSATEDGDACEAAVRDTFNGAPPPPVADVERDVERHGLRYLVHRETAVIR